MKEPEYQSPNSVGKRQTIPIDAADPRLKWNKKGQTLARSGAEIQVVSVTGGSDLLEAAAKIGISPIKVDNGQEITIPGINNQPPSKYPGGSGSYVYILTTPTALTAAWATDGSDSLIINFTWDSTDSNNATASGFNLLITDGLGNQAILGGFPITAGTSQTITLTKAQNISMFNVFTTTFTSIGVQAADPMNNTSAFGYVDPANLPLYVLRINPPKIVLNAVNLGYTLNFWEDAGTYGSGTFVTGATTGVPPTSGSWDGIEVWELETNSLPTVTLDSFNHPIGWTRTYLGKLDPVNISTTDVLQRYVIARFSSIGGTYTSFCSPVSVTPKSPVSVNVKQPTEATVTAAWSNNDIVLSYSLPGSTSTISNATGDGTTITYTASNTFNVGDPVQITGVTPSAYNIIGAVVNPTSTTFQVAGTATATYTSGGTATATNNAGASFIVTLTAPNNQVGAFYFTPSGVSLSGSFKITVDNLLAQFSSPVPSSYNILFQSVSQVGVKSNGASISLGSRTTGLSTQIPLPTFQENVDGIVATFDFTQYNASYGEVYISYKDCWTPLATSTTPNYSFDITDFYNASWSSGGQVNTNIITLNNFINEDGIFTDPTKYLGMPISGTGISKNTFVDSISLISTGTYQLTLKKYDVTSQSYVASNFTTQASGQYTMNMLVWSGSSPATIFNDSYAPLYLTVRYVDQFGQESYFSPTQTKTPLNPTTSLINSALAVQPGAGSIYLGTTATSLPNVIIGSNNNEAGIFIWGPDNTSGHTTLNVTPSTQIIGDNGSTYTFVTTNAKIADWSITSNHIQNDLSTGSSAQGYVGFSGSNSTYSIWAGASASDNTANDAKFSVTPAGLVTAKNIQIFGGNLDIGASSYTYTATGNTNSNILTSVSNTNNLVIGMYVFNSNIPVGTKITAIGMSTVTLSNNPTSNITAGPVTFVSQNGAHITNTGNLVASNAILSGSINATSGSFTGNVNISSNGSLYSGTLDTNGNLTSAGYIINSSGIQFSPSGYGTRNTYITSSGLTTTAANIGGWTINSNQITRIGSSGVSGSITLDSQYGTIYTTAVNVSGYTAGINGPFVGGSYTTPQDSPSAPIGGENVFWAGTGGATSTANAFRVTLNGNLYASKAYISGGLISVGSSSTSKNIINIDSSKEWISLGDSSGTAYLVSRNNNIYLTSPGTQLPWSGNQPAGTDTSSPTGKPYLAAGSSFKDMWGNSNVGGIGIYTGNWDYFTNNTSDPFIVATQSGLQLSASPSLGLILDKGTATGDAFSSPTMLIYTSQDTSTYSPSTKYGAWATFKNGQIILGTNSNTYTSSIAIAGDSTGDSTKSYVTISSSSNVYGKWSSAGIILQAGTSTTGGGTGERPYSAASGIQMGISANTVSIRGIPSQVGQSYNSSGTLVSVLTGDTGTPANYLGFSTLGPYPRQRMIVEDPYTGQLVLGMAVYYSNNSAGGALTPVSGGATGDLWVIY
jgi:hypothetical protein